jgi:iron complex transport system permease protein
LRSEATTGLVIPFSAIAGAIFVVLADTVARTAIAPRELPVGAVTALIGAPMFIYLLKRKLDRGRGNY